jgi:capsular exopolysaccharide synthesis family protein
MADPQTGDRSADWLRPRVEQQGLQRYVNTIRERLKLIIAVTVLTTLAAVAYLAVAPKVYEAKSELLVTPVPSDDPALSGLPIIRNSSDPTRDVETAARLIANRQVAERVRKEVPDAPDPLLKNVTAEPVAQSNLVAVTASAESGRIAQRVANGFAEQAIKLQTEKLHAALDKAIANLEARVEALDPREEAAPASPGEVSLRSQLTRLQTLRGGDDPTMSIQSRAAAPDTEASPKKKLTLIAGVLAGLILGIGGAFALQVLDPRLRREEQLRSLYGLPILGRIPKEGKGGSHALAPERLSPSTLEAYRTLRATLAATRRGTKTETPAILVTSPSPSEGKTTSAINLASSLALAGNSVILIEADLRRPAIGAALGVTTKTGTGSVLLGMADLEEALVETNAYGRYLRLLLADSSGGASGFMADQLFLPAAGHLVEDAKALADYVIVDSPPLAEVIDALPLAQQVDEVLVVVRLGRTQLTKLQNLGELLARSDIEPVGFAVVGVPDTGDGYYYASSAVPAKGRSKAGSGRASK